MKLPHSLSALLAVVALVAAACAPAAQPTPTPTTAPKPTTPPAAAPTPTAAAKPTAAPAAATPTAAPKPTAPAATPTAAAKPAMAPVSGSFTLWHGWTGAEEETLKATVADFQRANPNARVTLLAVPFDQLKNKFTTEASTGGGPELLIGPKDWIGELAQAKLITALDEVGKEILATLSPDAVEANRFQGKVWAFPESTEAVALWYNTDKVKTPPADEQALLKTGSECGLALNNGFYHFYGFIAGFGGQLFDANQKVILDQGGTVDALAWLRQAKQTPNVTVDQDGGKLDALFKDGKACLIINGPWATGDYAKALGKEKLAIAPPITITKTGKKFAPFLGTKNVFLSANAKGESQKAALGFVGYLVSPEVQATFAAKAGHVPAARSVRVDDKIIQGFIAQTQSASKFPNDPEMGAVWTPAGDMLAKVAEGRAEPAAAVKEATETINRANKKM